jgi:outer membrane lipoprotein SlyB
MELRCFLSGKQFCWFHREESIFIDFSNQEIFMFKGAPLWSGILSGGISQIEDVRSYMKGEIDRKDFTVYTMRNITGAVGIMAGMEYGALVGTMVFPGIGTFVGSLIGYMVGNRIGSTIGYKTGDFLVNTPRRLYLLENSARLQPPASVLK